MKFKRQYTIITMIILGCLSIIATVPTHSVLANEDSQPTSTRALIPDQKFGGQVGDHPLLESFGDVEGKGVLAATERDTGRYHVVPFSAKTTPNRQMAMKLGNFKMNTSLTYPTDELYVSRLVNENAINLSVSNSAAIWREAVFMDTASVGILSDDKKNFYDISTSFTEGRTASRALQNDYHRPTGLLIGQANSQYEPSIKLFNDEDWHWTYMIETAGGVSYGHAYSPKNNVVLMKMYNNPNEPYSVAYGAHVRKTNNRKEELDLLGYVRIIMQPINEDGRVRTSYSYVNLTTDPDREYSALYARYGAKLTETKSMGNDVGEYFKTQTVSIDKKPYAYSIYRDNYPVSPNNNAVNSPIGRVVSTNGHINSFEPGITPVDPGVSQKFQDKGLGYINQRFATPFGQPASWDIDAQGFNVSTLTVNHLNKETGRELAPKEQFDGLYGNPYEAEPKDIPTYQVADPVPTNAIGVFDGTDVVVNYYYSQVGDVTVLHKNEQGQEISPSQTFTGKITEKLSDYAKAIEIPGYAYSTVTPNINSNFTAKAQTVTFTYKEARFELKQTVFDANNQSLDQKDVANNQELTYKLTLNSLYQPDNSGVTYQEMTLIETVDQNLVNVKDFTLTTGNHAVVGTASYDDTTHQLTAKLTNGSSVLRSDDLVLEFKASVKEDVLGGTLIKAKGTAEGSYSDHSAASKKESSEVVSTVLGELRLVSAPGLVDLGELKMAEYNTKINVELAKNDIPLLVQDTRKNRQKWSITAEVIDFMANGSDVRKEALRYSYLGNEKPITEEPLQIYTNTGTDKNYSYNISNDWKNSDLSDGLKFKLDEGKAPIASNEYKGKIKWTLRNTID